MRAIWKGAVSFGLVNVPVRLMPATENHDLQFHQVRISDGSRIRYKKVAAADGEPVTNDEIAKGYETADGQLVVLTDDDLASLPSRHSREIEVEKFVPAEQVDPMLYDKTYYVEPDKAGTKPYALLREALRSTDRVAIVSVAVRTRLAMGVLRVVGNVIVLQTLLWPDEIRKVDELDNLDSDSAPKDAEVAMAKMLIDSMTSDFEVEDHEDDYQAAVRDLVEAKIAGKQTKQLDKPKDPDAGQVVDLLAALQRSVDKAKASRGESSAAATASADETDAEADEGSAEAKPAKKTAAKKTTAKKAAPKKKAG